MKKVFWALIVFLAVIAIYGFILPITSDSETITPNPPNEFKFDASQYPLVIDKEKYPVLSSFEKEISAEYESMLQAFAETFKEYGYECLASQILTELSFNYLKPRQNIYMIESICGVPGETSPFSGVPAILLYISEGKAVMFYGKEIASHFAEAFNNMETLDEAKEYIEQYVDTLYASLDSALNNSFLGGVDARTNFEKDCDFVSDAPELASTISKEGDGFIYEGLKIEGEGKARLYYLKYTLTPDGQVVKEKEEMLAMCRNMGFIY